MKKQGPDAAIFDAKLSDGALRLLLLIQSNQPAGPFPLPWKRAGALVGLSDKKTIYARIKQLCPKYLEPLGKKGLPPTNFYKLKK